MTDHDLYHMHEPEDDPTWKPPRLVMLAANVFYWMERVWRFVRRTD